MQDETNVIFTSLNKEGRVPVWANKMSANRCTFEKATDSVRKNSQSLIVIREKSVKPYLTQGSLLADNLAKLWANAPKSRLVAEVGDAEYDVETITSVLRAFSPEFGNRLDLAFGDSHLRAIVLSALAKIRLENSRPDPLGKTRAIVAATKDLRTKEGRLSAPLVAKAFGITDAALARLLKRHRQTISQNPDSTPLQKELRPYERIARLRVSLSKAEFLAWLNRPVGDLENQTPMEAIAGGHADAVADYAEDALLGTPA